MVELEKWQAQRAIWAQELVEIGNDLETEEDEGIRALLQDDKVQAQKDAQHARSAAGGDRVLARYPIHNP
ncbi:hypothetical protein [Aliiroseovarius marinus]|uniref:hypothetical protein n=1 Tax=Aliiroseovarius marinus TaxID=2500159 RepID=UPI003D7EFCE4